jgi:transposase
MPRLVERCQRLTEARADNPWLADVSVIVQQQAIRGHDQAMANFFAGTHRRPRWRKAGHDEGFRAVHVKRGDAKPGRNVRQKAGLNREIQRSGWGLLARRLEDKAPGRVERVNPAFTSQRCAACGHVAAESRESQALFRCVACTFACNADVNAARNIAAGRAVTARGGLGAARPMNREPQLLLQWA